MQLTLALSPRRPRNNVVFDHAHVTRMGGTNHHAIFDHVAGGTLCTRLFKHYTMPDGSTKHLYHPTKRLIDEVDVPPEPAPPPPSSMDEALQVYALVPWGPGCSLVVVRPVLVVCRLREFSEGARRQMARARQPHRDAASLRREGGGSRRCRTATLPSG
jgi:hypothetical protein